ncbi:MAG: hypothetical protein L0Y44_08345 [Phycisphaerales bacterium]|nr:hypothetical protein [Phycisphaerales bacterium]MCI0630645.1 hypothetical protein [Phycisphaerales bacterium]MCI0674282.1 hypothetical protein [Phycisphaerales bacterium]
MTRAPVSLPQVALPDNQRGFLQTKRTDTWWLFPTITLIYFAIAATYLTWAAWQGEHYWYSGPGGAQYLSPIYSPVLFSDSTRAGAAPVEHSWFGEWPSWLPKLLLGFIPLTPALLILWAPGGFRLTCYYYRGAYYKAFWGDPPNCAVGEPGFRGTRFRGERSLPLVIMNIHRYFLYAVIPFIFILSYDAIISFIFIDPETGSHRFGIGVGSLVITANTVLLASYTFGCHSLRHIIGGKKDCIASSQARLTAYNCVGCFNRWHMQWAWISLFWVGFADLYIRLCSMGIWSDWRIL